MTEQEKLDRERRLDEVEAKLGRGARDAISDHLRIVDERFYYWLADLYLPRKCICGKFDKDGLPVCLHPKDENGNDICRGGGFYYCNSARDTDGYEIDVESTAQAINFPSASGMLTDVPGGMPSVLPPRIKRDMSEFAKGLQSSDDGYFYHRQWGKNISLSRRGRDLSWATGLISSYGDGVPLYDTASGKKGSLGAPSAGTPEREEKTERETFAAWPEHIATVSAFREYLGSFDLLTKSYPAANTLAAQATQIKSRDAEGIKNGEFHDLDGDGIAEDGLIAAFAEHFRNHQKENGVWEEEVTYRSVNGLMKIALSYNTYGIPFPRIEAAFDAAVKIALLDADTPDANGSFASGSVYVYNPWVSISSILSYAKKFGEAGLYERLYGRLRDNAEALIRATTKKNIKFKKEDGSFGYTWSYPPAHSQGAPVCPNGIVEGDVNGGTIAIRGVFGNMCSALGVSIPIFYRSDLDKFISRLESKYSGVD